MVGWRAAGGQRSRFTSSEQTETEPRLFSALLFQSCDLNCDVDRQLSDEPLVGGANLSRVRLMANQLQAKMEESASVCKASAAAAALRQQVRLMDSRSCSGKETDTQ